MRQNLDGGPSLSGGAVNGVGGAPVGRDVRGRHGRSRRCPCAVADPLTSEASRGDGRGDGRVCGIALRLIQPPILNYKFCEMSETSKNSFF